MHTRKLWILLTFAVITASTLLLSSYRPAENNFHTEAELQNLRGGARSPIDSGEYFLGSVRCQGCHGFDTLHQANVDENGKDVNLYDDWESTMMALSAKDPLWRAKVSHEIMVNPAHANELQTKCTSCHAPMGHYSAMFKGQQYYTLADLLNDTLGLNGVACGGCHEIGSDSLIPLEFSGNVHYDTNHVEYGPFTNPDIGPMQLYVGLIPTHSHHMSTSKVCAACHTLQTKTVDLNGNYTGNTFTEQATYHEWLNSSFNDSQPCQHCHMPQINDPVVLANGYQNLTPRSPFNLHKFMGGNATMLKLIKQNKNALGIEVPDMNFDSTINVTLDLLRHSSVDMNLGIDSITTDTLFVSVQLTNKAGHKFPSGYPSRRAFLQFAVTAGNDTVFKSGMLQPDYEVEGHDAQVEPHYNTITNPNQVQIYEMAMGDVNNNRTTVLEQAAVELKDNRLPPAGFTTQHYAYDTTRIVGNAETDPDFNSNGSNEGTGKDIVHYHIPLNGTTGNLNVQAALYYQSIAPGFLTNMFSMHSAQIDSFKNMYQAADKAPVLIASGMADSVLIPTGINTITSDNWNVFPIPSANGQVILTSKGNPVINRIEIWDAAGRKVNEYYFNTHNSQYIVNLPVNSGIYYLKIYSGNSYAVKKAVRQ